MAPTEDKQCRCLVVDNPIACSSMEREYQALPNGMVLHDNALFESCEVKKEVVEASTTRKPVDPITLLCEEVSRLFTQYNTAFKRSAQEPASQALHSGLQETRRLTAFRCGGKAPPAAASTDFKVLLH